MFLSNGHFPITYQRPCGVSIPCLPPLCLHRAADANRFNCRCCAVNAFATQRDSQILSFSFPFPFFLSEFRIERVPKQATETQPRLSPSGPSFLESAHQRRRIRPHRPPAQAEPVSPYRRRHRHPSPTERYRRRRGKHRQSLPRTVSPRPVTCHSTHFFSNNNTVFLAFFSTYRSRVMS